MDCYIESILWLCEVYDECRLIGTYFDLSCIMNFGCVLFIRRSFFNFTYSEIC